MVRYRGIWNLGIPVLKALVNYKIAQNFLSDAIKKIITFQIKKSLYSSLKLVELDRSSSSTRCLAKNVKLSSSSLARAETLKKFSKTSEFDIIFVNFQENHRGEKLFWANLKCIYLFLGVIDFSCGNDYLVAP